MGKPLRLLNLALALVAALIAGILVKTWVVAASSSSSRSAMKPSQELAAVSFSRPVRPALAHFDDLLEKNLFKQPPPQRAAPPRPGPPPPPPLPLPTLIGTILVDDERRAILSDKGKADIYAIGQEVAGGTLTAISEDRVLFKRGDTVSELTLKAPIQPAPVSPPQGAHLSPSPPPGPPALVFMTPPPPPPQAIEGAPAPAEGKTSRAERRRLRLLQQQGQVAPSQETEE